MLLHLTDTHVFGPPPGAKSRIYYGTSPGFAEPGNINYDPINASIAYSRTLAVLRSTVGPRVDLEDVWDDNINYKLVEKKIDKMLQTMVDEPLVNHVRLIIQLIYDLYHLRFFDNKLILVYCSVRALMI